MISSLAAWISGVTAFASTAGMSVASRKASHSAQLALNAVQFGSSTPSAASTASIRPICSSTRASVAAICSTVCSRASPSTMSYW